MSIQPPTAGLLARQWQGYARYHQSRANLLLHLVAVPIFLIANVLLVVALLTGAWMEAGAAALAMAGSVMAQGRGHRLEMKPPEPFTGPVNALSRIFAEQWLTFPRFVLSGEWSRARHGS